MRKFNSTVSLDRVQELLSYDPETGEFRWKVDRNSRYKAGMIAGVVGTFGHITIGVDGKHVQAHRVAWALSYGEWPAEDVDHINGVPADNRLCNLRQVSRGHNLQNQKRGHRDNKSGYLGVTASGKKWAAKIYAEGVAIPLGRFDTPEIAHQNYLVAKRMLHPGNTI